MYQTHWLEKRLGVGRPCKLESPAFLRGYFGPDPKAPSPNEKSPPPVTRKILIYVWYFTPVPARTSECCWRARTRE